MSEKQSLTQSHEVTVTARHRPAPRPVNRGRQFVAVGRHRGAMAAIGQPTTLAAARAEADSLRLQGFDRLAVYELIEVKLSRPTA